MGVFEMCVFAQDAATSAHCDTLISCALEIFLLACLLTYKRAIRFRTGQHP